MWPNLLDHKYTNSNSNIWLFWPFSPQLVSLTAIHKLLLVLWLNVLPLLLTELLKFSYICWLPGTDLFLQHSHMFNGVQVRTLGRSFQNLNSSVIQSFLYHFWCVFGIIVLLEHPSAPNYQSSADDFWFSWRILEIIPIILHHSIKTSPSLLQTYCCSFSFDFIWPQSFPTGFVFVHVISSKLHWSFKMMHLSSCWCKTHWLWTLTAVFQQLLIHSRLALWCLLVGSWPSCFLSAAGEFVFSSW